MEKVGTEQKRPEELRENSAREQERNIATLEVIINSVATLSEIVRATIAKLAFLADESEHLLRPRVQPDGREQFDAHFRRLREELETLAFASKTMVGIPPSSEQTRAGAKEMPRDSKSDIPQKEAVPLKSSRNQ